MGLPRNGVRPNDVNRPGVWPRAIASRSEGVPVLARQAAVQDRFFDCDVNREEARLQAKLYRVPYMNLIRNILMPTVSRKKSGSWEMRDLVTKKTT